MSVAALLNNFSASSRDLQLLHRGYTADTYSFITDNGKFIAKHIVIKNGTILEEDLDAKTIFEREVASVHRLVKHNMEKVFVPEIEFEDPDNYLYVLRYYKFEKFNQLLRFFAEGQAEVSLFRYLGEYLSTFHGANIVSAEAAIPKSYLHGDLNNKNIGITADGRLVILDPGFRKHEVINSIYFDVARVLLNFFPYDIWLAWKVNQHIRFLGAQAFLNAYEEFSPVKVSRGDIIDYAIERNMLSRTNHASRKKYLKNMAMFVLGAHIHKELLKFKQYVETS